MKKEEILDFYKAIDRFDTTGFVSFLGEDARFKFANLPLIKGKNKIFDFVAGFFQGIKAIGHKNLEIWELEGIRFIKGTVTYTRHNRTTLQVDFFHTLRLKEDKIEDFQIFIDNSELFKKEK